MQIYSSSLYHTTRKNNLPVAILLINVETGHESEVLNTIKDVEGVVEAYAVYGVYDIVAKIKASSMDKLKEVISWQVRRLNNVRSTTTMLVVEN